MRISDWSSDVCSSDLLGPDVRQARRSGQPRPDGPRDRQNRTVHLQPVLLDTRGEGEDKAVGIFPVFMHVAQGDVAHQNGAVKKPGIVTEGLQIAQFAREIAVVGLAVIDPADQPDPGRARARRAEGVLRSEEHTSELQSLMRISYAV